MAAEEPPSPGVQALRKQFADLAQQEARQRRGLKIANYLVLGSSALGTLFFVAAALSVRAEVAELRVERGRLVEERDTLHAEIKGLKDEEKSLHSQIETLRSEKSALQEWADGYYRALDAAADSNNGEAARILDATPPPPGADALTEARQLWREGQLAATSGDNARAEARYLQAIKVDPKYVRALNSLGLLTQKKGDRQAALSYYKRAIEANPSYGPAIANLASLYNQQNDIPEAVFWCWQGRQLPDAPKLLDTVEDSLRGIGQTYSQQGAAHAFLRGGERLLAAGEHLRGAELLRKACALGDQRACRSLRKRCASGLAEACDSDKP